ncbi:hypothetical protein [Aeoliella mucimassa]|uniref:hypothetical protein n=1 Tax=Aeoliella mucimassa TaxID=2527972 RepID=UPI0011A2B1E1|nr:hypothetical protein [Aeoliella mucimassa]
MKSPALTSAKERVDANDDDAISADEIAQRIKVYDSQSSFVPVTVQLRLGGRPLEMATVTFAPESFMGEMQSFTGVSDATGYVMLSGEEQKLPGLPQGFYTITITREGGEQTIQGCEIADDVPEVSRMTFNL